MTSVFRLWHSDSMGMRTYTILLAWRLLWPRRSCQRLVAGICVLGIALGLMLQIVVRGVMDGMVREIDAGTRFCMPDLLVTNWPYDPEQALRVPGVRSATACQAGMGTGPHGLCRYSTWYEPEQLAPLLADGGLGQALISRSYAEKSGLRAGDYLLMQLPGHHVVYVRGCGLFLDHDHVQPCAEHGAHAGAGYPPSPPHTRRNSGSGAASYPRC